MDAETIKKRTRAIRQQLIGEKADCLIVTSPANVSYVTGFTGADSWAVITKDRAYLLTDSRYTEQAGKDCVGCKIIQRPDTVPIVEAATELVKARRLARIIIEDSASLTCFQSLRKNLKSYANLRSSAGLIESQRCIKDRNEIVRISKAAAIAAKALRQTLLGLKPGITENELAGFLDFQIRKLGAVSSFDTIVAFGPNASRPHHRPGTRRLKKNDAVLIDFGAKYKGYCCDITRCFAVGAPSTFYTKVYHVVEQAQAAAIKMVRAGVKISQVDAAAREVIAKNGLPVYGHGTGHGLGLEIHELPYIKAKTKGNLRAGVVITIEPGVYMPGRLGVRIEDDVLVTENGCELLTGVCPHASWRT
jgi:Xaa-Pro aminopeptidase